MHCVIRTYIIIGSCLRCTFWVFRRAESEPESLARPDGEVFVAPFILMPSMHVNTSNDRNLMENDRYAPLAWMAQMTMFFNQAQHVVGIMAFLGYLQFRSEYCLYQVACESCLVGDDPLSEPASADPSCPDGMCSSSESSCEARCSFHCLNLSSSSESIRTSL